MNTWRKMITKEMAKHDETWDDLRALVFKARHKWDEDDNQGDPDPDDIKACLDHQFADGYGSTEGLPFTLWTVKRVYFPVCYDGSEWVESVPREPNGEATEHVGGG